jgi:hypothetical protein
MSLPSITNAFSFGMSSMDMLNALTGSQSMSQVSNVGFREFLDSLPSCSLGWRSYPFSFPSIGSGAFPSSIPNPFGGWGASMGRRFQSTSMPSTLTPFTLYGGFKSNPFTMSAVSAGGNPFQAQWNPMQGSFPLQGMSSGGNPFPSQWNPMQGGLHLQGGLHRGKPYFSISGIRWVGVFFHLTRTKVSPKALAHPQTLPGNLVPVLIQGPSFQAANQSMSQPRLPFLETLHFPYFSKLMNDLIHHDLSWPMVPTKLPLDIPKFEGKSGEDPQDHVMMFHLWCSSNSLNDDSIWLRLFQCTLTGGATKWYIELERSKYAMFGDLAMVFLNHFQLPVWYDVGTKF